MEYAAFDLKELADDSKDSKLLHPPISAIKHAMRFLSTIVDRSATSLATTILIRRDGYLAQVDNLLPEEEMVNLRAASLMDTRLFAGQVASALPRLEDKRKYSKERESVQALTSLAKKGVEKSQGSSFSSASKKKSKVKYNTGSFTQIL